MVDGYKTRGVRKLSKTTAARVLMIFTAEVVNWPPEPI